MSNYGIALSGMRVAQRAIELIGTNIANAATEGYHKQEVIINPISFGNSEAIGSSGGAEISQVRRRMDLMLELELIRQRPALGQVGQELMTMQSIEAALGDLDSDGLGSALGEYFNALTELTAQPNSQALRERVIWAAEQLSQQFHNLSAYFDGLRTQILQEAQHVAGRINELAETVAGLNTRIQDLANRGGNTNILADQRDKAISELADLMSIKVSGGLDGSDHVNVEGWGMPIVLDGNAFRVQAEMVGENLLGIAPANVKFVNTQISGGKFGGLAHLHNQILPELQGQLDALAGEIIRQVNQIHVQGVGPAGSFTRLEGVKLPVGSLADFSPHIVAGEVRMRVIAPDGSVTRPIVAVDPNGTLDDLAAAFSAIPGLQADVVGGALHLLAEEGYRYDFLPEPMLDVDTSPWTGQTPAVGGIYTGSDDETFTLTVVADAADGEHAQVGVTSGLALEVRNAAGELLTRMNVGSGYAAGQPLNMPGGMYVALGVGELVVGESFQVTGLSRSDTSGALSELGLNTFFTGSDAGSIAVNARLKSNPQLLAGAIGADGVDNENLRRLADLRTATMPALRGATLSDAFREFATGIGQRVSTLQSRRSGLESVRHQLLQHRDAVSGVDINEEAARLMLFETMFQAVARFLTTQEKVMESLMRLI